MLRTLEPEIEVCASERESARKRDLKKGADLVSTVFWVKTSCKRSAIPWGSYAQLKLPICAKHFSRDLQRKNWKWNFYRYRNNLCIAVKFYNIVVWQNKILSNILKNQVWSIFLKRRFLMRMCPNFTQRRFGINFPTYANPNLPHRDKLVI